MSITIQKSGVLDTFQDLGRNGFRQLGINPNGAMDRTAVRLINILLGNNENEAVLEMHFPASKIKFNEETIFALGGANFSAQLDKEEIKNWKIYKAKKNSILKFTKKVSENRCYLSIKGGFELDKWLESASTNLTAVIGGFEGRKLKKDDEIKFNSQLKPADQISSLKIARSIIPHYSKFPTIRIIAGKEFRDLTALSEQIFLSQNYRLGLNSDRMGFRLEGEPLHLLNENELLSSAVNFGTVQLLPDGQLILLMADHQTSGGYPKIAHVIEQDLSIAAQLGTGDGIGFHLISIDEAEKLKIAFEKDLSFLKMGVRFSS